MQRRTKQILWGALTLLVLGVIIFGLWKMFIAQPPSCFDKKKNQQEEQVDCGGSCVPCAVLNAKEIKVYNAHLYKSVSGSGVVVQLYNQNIAVAARIVPLIIHLKNELGTIVSTVEQKTTLYAGEIRYVVVPLNSNNIANAVAVDVSIDTTKIQWMDAKQLPRPAVAIQNIQTVKEDFLMARGTIQNSSEYSYAPIRVTAVVFNHQGDILFGSYTTLDSIQKFSTARFAVPFPKNLELYQPYADVPMLTQTVTIGDTGEAVRFLQSYLFEQGLLPREPTNYFDQITSNAVAEFQKKNGLSVTGLCDKATQSFINAQLEKNNPKPTVAQTEQLVDSARTQVFLDF